MPSIVSISTQSREKVIRELSVANDSTLSSNGSIDAALLERAGRRLIDVARGRKASRTPPSSEKVKQRVEELKRAIHSTSKGGEGACVRLFVAGAKTHIGKTSVCLGILGALRASGMSAKDMAYIKPATQCERPDLLSMWCAKEGITYVGSSDAPLVFQKGFTRAFLDGKKGTSKEWIKMIADRIDQLAKGRRFVLVDGVGFPSVGSVVGVSNVEVAKAARAPVLIVGPSGVGGAIDTFNLNATFFRFHDVRVIGGVFNFAKDDGSYYSHDKCAVYIRKWFSKLFPDNSIKVYGVVPTIPSLSGLREKVGATDPQALASLAKENVNHFAQFLDLASVFLDAAKSRVSLS